MAGLKLRADGLLGRNTLDGHEISGVKAHVDASDERGEVWETRA